MPDQVLRGQVVWSDGHMPSINPLTVTTVLYGGDEVLAETLISWRSALDSAPHAVVIVDNSPDESTSQLARRRLGAVDLVRRPNNPGFAESANEAISRCATEWVLLLNADVFLTADALEACVAWIAAPERDPMRECAALSLVTNGEEHCGVELDAVGYFSDRPAGSIRPPLGPSGGAMLIHRATFDAAGRFDGDLFAWGEDGGLSLRLTARGVRTYPLRSGLVHTGGHSVPSLAGLRFKARLLARNRIRVMRRDWTAPLMLTIGLPQLTLILLNTLRKLQVGTARQHLDGVRIALLERAPSRNRRRFGLRDFLRYRLSRTPASIPHRRG